MATGRALLHVAAAVGKPDTHMQAHGLDGEGIVKYLLALCFPRSLQGGRSPTKVVVGIALGLVNATPPKSLSGQVVT